MRRDISALTCLSLALISSTPAQAAGVSFSSGGTADPMIADAWKASTAAGNLAAKDSANNLIGNFVDGGAVGSLVTTSSLGVSTGGSGALQEVQLSYTAGAPQLRWKSGASLTVGDTGADLTIDSVGNIAIAAATGGVTNSGGRLDLAGTVSGPLAVRIGSTASTGFDIGYVAADGNKKTITSNAADSATTEAFRLAVSADLTTAGSKILSLGDASGTTYSEKLAVDLNGVLMTDAWRALTVGGNVTLSDSAGNLGATFFDDGTTMSMALTGTKSRGTITLSGGTGTATVNSGAICTCADSTAANVVKCAVSATTLTATGTGTDVIPYLCL